MARSEKPSGGVASGIRAVSPSAVAASSSSSARKSPGGTWMPDVTIIFKPSLKARSQVMPFANTGGCGRPPAGQPQPVCRRSPTTSEDPWIGSDGGSACCPNARHHYSKARSSWPDAAPGERCVRSCHPTATIRSSCYADVPPQPSLAEDHLESLGEIFGVHRPARPRPRHVVDCKKNNPSVERPSVRCLHHQVSLLASSFRECSSRHNSLVEAMDVILGTHGRTRAQSPAENRR